MNNVRCTVYSSQNMNLQLNKSVSPVDRPVCKKGISHAPVRGISKDTLDTSIATRYKCT